MTLTIEIKDEKVSFVKELLGNLSFVKIKDEGNSRIETQKVFTSIQKGLGEVKLHQGGKKSMKTLDELLNDV